jgi:U32 family peptidase
MKKPELLVTPTKVSDIPLLAEAGATAIMIGEERFGLRLAGEFKRDALKEAIEMAHAHNMKAYVAMNAIFHNEKIEAIEEYVKYVDSLKADAIVFGDPAVVMIVREVAPNMPMHWNTETTATNWFTCNYWIERGAKRAVLARELNMESIVEMKEHVKGEVEVQVHGMTCMFQSKRLLVGNYYKYREQNMEVSAGLDGNLFLYDPERDAKYPIYEDENGTHIMSPNDICIIDDLQEMIEAGVDSFKIDGVLKTTEYIVEVTKKYRKAIDLCIEDVDAYDDVKDDLYSEIEELQPVNRLLDTGFFYKETVY